MATGGIGTLSGQIFNVGTRTRRTGLLLVGTARDSRDTSLVSTVTAVRWNNSAYSNEVPLLLRFKTAGAAHRIFGDLGVEGSTATSRLLVGTPGSTTYTSVASTTWSDWQNVAANYNAKSEDGVHSHVLCGVAGRGVFSYEVQTVPKVKLT